MEYWSNGVATLHQADARAIPLPDASVHMCVTSPPYWGLRDYGLGQWQGGDAECGHVQEQLVTGEQNSPKQNSHPGSQGGSGPCLKCGAIQQPAGIGLEPTLGEWVQNIVAVGREVWRVLRDDGSFWLNLGDAYSGSWGNYSPTGEGGQRSKKTERWERPAYADNTRLPPAANMPDLRPKNLMGQPWRVAFALQDDGWLLRSAIVWHKPNPMPESVRDRPTNAYEMIFLLAKSGKYYYDGESIRQPHAEPGRGKGEHESHTPHSGRLDDPKKEQAAFTVAKREYNPAGANARNVWSIPTQGRPDAHFATYPDELPRRCILAGTSERGVCTACGAPWVRQTETELIGGHPLRKDNDRRSVAGELEAGASWAKTGHKPGGHNQVTTLGWQPTCGCNADTVPATVLDPFAGSGTTLAVAQALGRQSIGLDLNPEYLEIAKRYINRADGITLPMALA